MADIEQRLRDLEETLSHTESMIHKEKSNMPTGDEFVEQMRVNYLYIVGALIPIVTALVLYFMKPAMVTKDNKGKKLEMSKLLMWVGVVTILVWGLMFGLKYFGIIDKEA